MCRDPLQLHIRAGNGLFGQKDTRHYTAIVADALALLCWKVEVLNSGFVLRVVLPCIEEKVFFIRVYPDQGTALRDMLSYEDDASVRVVLNFDELENICPLCGHSIDRASAIRIAETVRNYINGEL